MKEATKVYLKTEHRTKRLLNGQIRGVAAVRDALGFARYSDALAIVRAARRKDLIGGDE